MRDEGGIRALGVSAPRRSAADVLEVLRTEAILDESLRPIRSGDLVVFPIRADPPTSALEVLSRLGARVSEGVFQERLRRPRSIKEALSQKLSGDILSRLPSSFDVIGDIAVIHIPPGLEDYAGMIGEAVLRINPSVKVVLGEAGSVEGVYRTRRFVHLAGEDRTWTIHRENRCTFRVDLSKSFFTPRLSGERMRIARQVGRGEIVADMFAGVGPFAIAIARNAGAKVYAAEINPEAYKLLTENLELNRVSGIVTPLFGDCRTVLRERGVKADRVIMNYPSNPLDFLESALEAMRGRGVIHLYGFTGDPEEWGRVVEDRLAGLGASCEVCVRVLRPISPRRWLVGADAQVTIHDA